MEKETGSSKKEGRIVEEDKESIWCLRGSRRTNSLGRCRLLVLTKERSSPSLQYAKKKRQGRGIPLSFFSRFVFVTYETSVAGIASLFSDGEENIYISEKKCLAAADKPCLLFGREEGTKRAPSSSRIRV